MLLHMRPILVPTSKDGLTVLTIDDNAEMFLLNVTSHVPFAGPAEATICTGPGLTAPAMILYLFAGNLSLNLSIICNTKNSSLIMNALMLLPNVCPKLNPT